MFSPVPDWSLLAPVPTRLASSRLATVTLTIQEEGSGEPSAQTLARMVLVVPGVTCRRLQ